MKYNRRAVRRLREEKGLTLPQLAKLAHIGHNTLYYVEAGVSEPRANTLAKLATALAVATDAFFEKSVEKSA